MQNIGIYVHFPFCVSKCNYCNFNSYDDKDDLKIDYFQALIREIEMYKTDKYMVDTIFIGGGTPSVMSDGTISTLISHIRKNFNVATDAEITIEANPNSITQSKVREWKEAGVNRVSVGLQTTNNNCLKLIGRSHTRADYIRAIEIIKSFGISNINTDCLIGLPKQKLSHLKHTLNLVTKLGCNHVSVYSLILEEDTPLYTMVRDGDVKLPKDEKTLNMYNFTYKYLRSLGFDRYEVSNYARAGYECRHNQNTWKMCEYLGFGAGAHGYYKGKRYNNYSQIEVYIDKIKSGSKPIENIEKVTKVQEFEETIMLGLRTREGIDLDQIKKDFKIDLLKEKNDVINDLMADGLLNLVYNRLIVSSSGLAVLNKIILDLVS